MSNGTSAPFGFKPIRYKNGAPYNGACTPYYAPSDYATAIYVGDPVVTVAAGANDTASPEGHQIGALQEINVATTGAGNYITGVVVGVGPDRDDLSKQYGVASTARVVMVADDPDLVFIGQEDSAGSESILVTDLGLNTNIVAGSGGSTVTGLSSWQLDSSAANTTNTLQVKILRLHDQANNPISSADTTANYAIFEFIINLHTQRYATGI